MPLTELDRAKLELARTTHFKEIVLDIIREHSQQAFEEITARLELLHRRRNP